MPYYNRDPKRDPNIDSQANERWWGPGLGVQGLLRGSWDLVTRVITKVTIKGSIGFFV